MIRTVRFILPLLLFPLLISAQTKHLTVEDASYMNPKLTAASLGQLQWRPGTEEFVYVAKNCLVRGQVSKPLRDTLVRMADMNLLLKINKLDTVKRFPSITFLNADQFYYTNLNKLYVCDLIRNTIEPVATWKEDAENIDVDPAGKQVAYTLGNNLFIASDGKEIRVSDEKNEGILFGSSRVHRNEFGISKGNLLVSGRRSACFLPDGREHGGRVPACGYPNENR